MSVYAAARGVGDYHAATGELGAKRQRLAYPPPTLYGTDVPEWSTEDLDDAFAGRDGDWTVDADDGATLKTAVVNITPWVRQTQLHKLWNVEGTMLFVVTKDFPVVPRDQESSVQPVIRYDEAASAAGFTGVVSFATLNKHLATKMATLRSNGDDLETRKAAGREIARHVSFYGIVAGTNSAQTEATAWKPANEMAVTVQGYAHVPGGFEYVDDISKQSIDTVTGLLAAPAETESNRAQMKVGDHLFIYYRDDTQAFHAAYSHRPVHGKRMRSLFYKRQSDRRRLFKVGRIAGLPDGSILANPETFRMEELPTTAQGAFRHMQIAMTGP